MLPAMPLCTLPLQKYPKLIVHLELHQGYPRTAVLELQYLKKLSNGNRSESNSVTL